MRRKWQEKEEIGEAENETIFKNNKRKTNHKQQRKNIHTIVNALFLQVYSRLPFILYLSALLIAAASAAAAAAAAAAVWQQQQQWRLRGQCKLEERQQIELSPSCGDKMQEE